MKKCRSGRVIQKQRKGEKYFFLRLNFVDSDLEGTAKYTTKDIPTGLKVSKRNSIKANAILDDAIIEHSTDSRQIYFHNYLWMWLESKLPTLEETSQQNYKFRVKIIADYFSERKVLLTELQPNHLNDFGNFLLTTERQVGKRFQIGYSNCTVKNVFVILRMALEDAVVMGYIAYSPASRIKTPKKPTDFQQRAYVGIDEIELFLKAIQGHRLEVLFLMVLYYGMRREEVLGLKWNAVRNDRLYIEHTVTLTDHVIAKDRAKTDVSYRSYPLLAEIRDKLQEIGDRQDENRKLFGDQYVDSDYIFTWEDGRTYRPDYITKSFKKLVRGNERLDDTLTLHSLRASCVSILIHRGIDIKDVQTWVGHKDVHTTLNVYARTNEKQQAKVANAMSDVFFNRTADDS